MLDRRWCLRMGLVGACLIVLLAPVAVIYSQRALQTTFNSPIDWVPSNFPERVQWSQFSQRFQPGDTVFISWPGATLDNPALQWVAEAIEQAEPERIVSATSGRELFDSLVLGPFGVRPEEAANRLRGSVVGEPRLGPDDSEIAAEERQSLVVVLLDKKGSYERIELIPRLRMLAAEAAEVPLEEIRIVGIPVEGAVIDASAAESVGKFAVPSAVIAILICWLCLRSIWLTAAISSVAMVGQGLALAAVLLTGQPMNAILIVLPPLVFVLTVSAGIHLSNYFLEAAVGHADDSVDPVERQKAIAMETVNQALRAGVPPCLLAAGTTIIGLGSLGIVQIVPVKHFGIIAALSIALTLLLLLMVLPATMVITADQFSSRRRLGRWSSFLKRQSDRFYRLPTRYPTMVILTIFLLAGYFVYGLSKIETSVSVSNLFAPDHAMRQDYEWFEQQLGPVVGGELEIRFDAPANSEPLERLKLVNSIHVAIAGLDGVSGVLSPGALLPSVPNTNSITTRLRRSAIVSQIENLDGNSALVQAGFLSQDHKNEYWRVSYRLPLQGDYRYEKRLNEIGDRVREIVSDSGFEAHVTSTGGVMLIEAAQGNLLEGLLYSFSTAFIAVALVMMILLRSVLGGCLAMLPNALPTLVTFGVLGLMETPLDIGAVMTASLALGIAVDDTVHLLSRFSSFRLTGQSAMSATLAALRQCGPAMGQTTLVCGVSLLVYGFSDFLPTRRFSILMVCLLGTAIVGDLLLLPALLSSRFGDYFARPVLATAEPLLESDAELPPDLEQTAEKQ